MESELLRKAYAEIQLLKQDKKIMQRLIEVQETLICELEERKNPSLHSVRVIHGE